jgi:hypothetical protein
MGPESAKSFPGREPVVVRQPAPAEVISSKHAGPVGRATQEADYGRLSKGYVFGAFRPADGEALAAPYAGQTTANSVDFLVGSSSSEICTVLEPYRTTAKSVAGIGTQGVALRDVG